MACHMHHVHLFASDLDGSIEFYREFFDGKVVLDIEAAGARNVFMRVGTGRIHFYDQPPKDSGRGAIHHFGIQTDNLEALVAKMKARGVKFRKEMADFGFWRYVMAPAPDGVLIELFEVDKEKVPAEYRDYFE